MGNLIVIADSVTLSILTLTTTKSEKTHFLAHAPIAATLNKSAIPASTNFTGLQMANIFYYLTLIEVKWHAVLTRSTQQASVQMGQRPANIKSLPSQTSFALSRLQLQKGQKVKPRQLTPAITDSGIDH